MLEVIARGTGEFRPPDPDGFREYVRDHKERRLVSKVDVGWMEFGPILNRAVKDGSVKLMEWSNGALAYRLLAGSLGVPYLPMRYLGGTDTFQQSGAILTEDPS